MTCKECIHFEVCDSGRHIGEYIEDDGVYTEGVEKECPTFKDRRRFLEAPCKVGDKFYSVLTEFGDWSVEESEIIGICIETGEWYVESKDGEFWKVGTDLCLLDKADAERVLKERASGKKN